MSSTNDSKKDRADRKDNFDEQPAHLDPVKTGIGKRIVNNITVEPCVILFAFSFGLYSIQIQNLWIEKTCKVGSYFFGDGITYSDEVCDNLFNGSFKEEQKVVQEVVASVEMYSSLMKQIPVVIIALFIGPWSDRAGRKLLILFPFVGYFLLCVILLLNTYFFDELYVEFLWMENISAFFGSWVIFFIGCYGYLADTTSSESRTMRIAIVDGCFNAVNIVANYANAPLYNRFHYYGSFGAGAICNCIGFFFVLFAFKETRKNVGDTSEKKTSIASIENLLCSFKCLFRSRREGMRHVIILMVTCMVLSSLTYSSVDYLYIRRKFDFPDENTLITWYTHLSSYLGAGEMVSIFIVLPVMIRFLGFHDMAIVLLASCALLSKALIYYFAESSDIIYLSIIPSIFSPLVTQPLRSSLTKIVGQGDVGAVFACVGSLQAASGFLTPLYNRLYQATLDSDPGAVFLVQGGFFTTMAIILLYLLIFLKRREKAEPSIYTVSYNAKKEEVFTKPL